MNKAAWLAKRNYWIAGIGALVSLFSFFALTFLNISYSFSMPGLGTGSTTSTTPVSIPVAGTALATYESLLWISVVLLFGILGAAIWFLVRRSPFGAKASMKVQARWTALGFIVAAVLSALCLVASLALIAQSYQSLVDGNLGSLGSLGSSFSDFFHFDFSWGIGAYLFVAGLIVIVVAAVLELVWPVNVLSDAEMALQWNYPQSQYTYPNAQNQYTYPPTTAPGSMPGSQPFADPNSQYGGSAPYPQSSYPPGPGQHYPASSHQPPHHSAGPYQPPAEYPASSPQPPSHHHPHGQ